LTLFSLCPKKLTKMVDIFESHFWVWKMHEPWQWYTCKPGIAVACCNTLVWSQNG
jgi:hypothetical protein